MTQTEALRLALEALQELENTNSYWWQEVDEATTKKIDPAITAIKAALEAKDEPVAWYRDEDGIRIYYDSKVWDDATPLYTTPPQRKPLTDEHLEAMAEKYVTNCYFDTLKFARAIEAAHGIKGEA